MLNVECENINICVEPHTIDKIKSPTKMTKEKIFQSYQTVVDWTIWKKIISEENPDGNYRNFLFGQKKKWKVNKSGKKIDQISFH